MAYARKRKTTRSYGKKRRSTKSKARYGYRPKRNARRRTKRRVSKRSVSKRRRQQPRKIVLVLQHQPVTPTLATPQASARAVRARFSA